MARPKKQESEKLSQKVEFKVDAETKAALKEWARLAKQKEADLARNLLIAELQQRGLLPSEPPKKITQFGTQPSMVSTAELQTPPLPRR